MLDWRRQQYEHNKAFSNAIDRVQYPDWAITGLFYAAVQLVDAVFEKKLGSKPKTHMDRTAWMSRVDKTKRVRTEYWQLKILSESVRYDAAYTQFAAAQIGEATAYLEAVEKELLSSVG